MKNFQKILLIIFFHFGFETSISAPVISLYYNSNKSNLSLDDQCRQIYASGHNSTGPAFNRTICGTSSGKSCLNGKCVTVLVSCYGDNLVTQHDFNNTFNIPKLKMTCSEALTFISSQKYDPVYFCNNKNISFGSTCCDSCSIYKSIDCIDKLYKCSLLSQFCTNTIISTQIREYCPYTCGSCNRTLITCENSGEVCKNEAICVNRKFIIKSNLGFTCSCKAGYSGAFCQNVNPCLVNGGPCLNDGTCQKLGSNGYKCLCKTKYYGDNCSQINPKCPSGWILFNNSCFYIYKKDMTFNNSITYCASQSINSYLADIDSKAEFDFIQNYMSTQAPNNSIWIGLKVQNSNYSWYKTGKILSINSSFWNKVSPNCYSRGCNCVFMRYDNQRLDDYFCDNTYYPLCKI